MAESKRTFQSAKMDKDIDDRILPAGTYRDALNVSVDFSEDANVGALENLKGNELIANQDITGLSAATNPNAEVVGSIAHPEENKIYYFVSGDKSDGIFEYDVELNTVSTVIIDSSSPPPAPTQLKFTFANSLAQASVAVNGAITVTSALGEIESITQDFNETVATNTSRTISVRVKVPNGYSNEGDYVSGTLTATQQAVAAPVASSISILEPTNVASTSVTLNAKYTQDAASLTDIGFYYAPNTGGSSSVNLYSNKFVITNLIGNSANISSGAPDWTDPFDTVEPDNITVIDGNGNLIASSNYVYERFYGAQPSVITFNSDYLAILPVTIAQTDTLTTVNDALTSAQIVSTGTQVSLSSNITSPFNTDITGLSASTDYAAVSYVTNSSGTTYSEALTFSTEAVVAPSYNALPDDRIFIFPTADDDQYGANLYPGYREFEKDGGDFYFAAVASKASGLYNDYNDLTSGVAWSNSGVNFTYNDTELQNFAKTSSVNVSTASAGVYTVTAAKSGLTSGTTQIVVGSPSGTRYKSTFTLNFAKTGTGTVPFVAAFDHSSTGLHWNASPAPLAEFSIGPFSQGQDGVIMIPLSTDNTVVHSAGTTSEFNNGTFNPENLNVSITGKTEGVDYEYYIATEAMGVWGGGIGPVPAVIIEADPYVLNGGVANATHTLNITYNY